MRGRPFTEEDIGYIKDQLALGVKRSVIADEPGRDAQTLNRLIKRIKEGDTDMAGGVPTHGNTLAETAPAEERNALREAEIYAKKHPLPGGVRLDGTPKPRTDAEIERAEADLVEILTPKPEPKPERGRAKLTMVEATYKGAYARVTIGCKPGIEVFAAAEGGAADILSVLDALETELEETRRLIKEGGL